MDYVDLSICTLRVGKLKERGQDAKPGHGGVLPAAKVSAEIAAIRGVAIGEDRLSPASHSAFSTPIEMMRFTARFREFCGGKPVGLELCIGHPWEFLGLCKGDGRVRNLSRFHRRRRQGAAPARRRSNSPTGWACRCARV